MVDFRTWLWVVLVCWQLFRAGFHPRRMFSRMRRLLSSLHCHHFYCQPAGTQGQTTGCLWHQRDDKTTLKCFIIIFTGRLTSQELEMSRHSHLQLTFLFHFFPIRALLRCVGEGSSWDLQEAWTLSYKRSLVVATWGTDVSQDTFKLPWTLRNVPLKRY